MGDQHGTPHFTPGLELAEDFFREAVAPIIASEHPGLEYTAALIGCGSEVLGLDDEMSTDHHWGPRVMLFLRPADLDRSGRDIGALLSDRLPRSFRDYPTSFAEPDPGDHGVQRLAPTTTGPVHHRVEMFTIAGFFQSYLGIGIDEELRPEDWLTLPQQKLRSICAGRVFRDDLDLDAVRARLAWYPHDVWLYMLASGWARIGQEEHLMGRAGSVGDDIGSAVIAGRLVRDVMRLTFMMERRYPPYAKWLGAAFAELDSAPALRPALTETLRATSWQARESGLCAAYRVIADMHNRLALTETLPVEPSPFWGRPFRVIHAGLFEEALKAAIDDPGVRAIAARGCIGGIDLLTDNTYLLEDQTRRAALRELYR
jgi:hypothetical protein